MNIPKIDETSPLSWHQSFVYDQIEVFGSNENPAYSNAYKNRVNSLIGFVKKYTPSKGSILDIAAGSGNITLALANEGFLMTWNDLREDLIPYVKQKEAAETINYLPGNIFDLDTGNFDAVIISEIIEHTAHPDEFLKKITTLVKRGGFIFLSTPIGSYFLNRLPRFSTFTNPEVFEKIQFQPNADGHIFLLHIDEIVKMADQNGLTVIEKKLNNNPLTSGHIKLHYLLRILPVFIVRFMEKLTNSLPLCVSKKLHANMVIVLQKSS